MELPLSISNLQEQWLLSFLKKLDPANITELFWQLRPYVVLHHVEFKESSFSFLSVGSINFVDIVGFGYSVEERLFLFVFCSKYGPAVHIGL